MTALVLGCGPAGLLAAHALVTLGHEVEIVSKKRKSEMYGAQYLHRPIPNLGRKPVEVAQIDYLLSGSIEGYRDKVYGENWSGVVSPDEFGNEENHLGWDIRDVYDRLWRMYGHHVQDYDLPHGAAIQDLSRGYIRVVSTVPAPLLCLRREEHVFRVQKVWAIGDAPERGIFCPVKEAPDNTVLCNGDPYVSWYRTANIFGYRTAEWPGGRRPPFEGVAEVDKPLSTTCDCQPGVERAGRYGKWQKGVLSHTAYYDLVGEKR